MDKLIETIQVHKGKVLSAIVAAIIAVLATVTDIGVQFSGEIAEKLESAQSE